MKHGWAFPNTEVRFLAGFHVPGYCETDGTASMMIPEGLPFCHGAKIRIACESALAQTADFAVPPFAYHHGANAGATTGGILFHTFEGV
jgi:hypothetical protein